MEFEKNQIYHVFNRGNNKERIFYCDANYTFFQKKLKKYISPHADFLAWCLMPNHFHLMIEVIQPIINGISLNQSIGRMLSSYTRAINKQEKRTGSLFQQHTKAVCVSQPPKLVPAWYMQHGITVITPASPEKEYPFACMRYIHNNPLVDGYAKQAQKWKYSSLQEYLGLIDKPLINLNKGRYYFTE